MNTDQLIVGQVWKIVNPDGVSVRLLCRKYNSSNWIVLDIRLLHEDKVIIKDTTSNKIMVVCICPNITGEIVISKSALIEYGKMCY